MIETVLIITLVLLNIGQALTIQALKKRVEDDNDQLFEMLNRTLTREANLINYIRDIQNETVVS